MYRQLAASETGVSSINISFDSYLLHWKVVTSLLHVVAVSSTVYRLWERFSLRRAWWDDYVLFLPLVLDIFYAIFFWFYIPQELVISDSEKKISFAVVVLNSYWFTRPMYTIIVWSTRIVLALSLARLFPKRSRPRMCSMLLVAMMASFCLANIFISATTCKRKTALLLANEATDCVKSIGGVPLANVFFFAGDIITDVLLVLCPMFWFWNIRLPPKERQLILLAFCGNLLTLLSAIAYMLLSVFARNKDLSGMARVQTAFSLFVCNFTVLTTALYRLVRRRRPSVPASPATATSAPAHETSLVTDAYPLTQFRTTDSSSSRSTGPLTLTEISSFSSAHSSSYARDTKDMDSKLTASSIT